MNPGWTVPIGTAWTEIEVSRPLILSVFDQSTKPCLTIRREERSNDESDSGSGLVVVSVEELMGDLLKDVPLQSVCKEAERLTRELIDHLEQNLVPGTRDVHDLVKPDSPFNTGGATVQDVTVRNRMATLLESQEFAEQLFLKTREYLETIDESIGGSSE